METRPDPPEGKVPTVQTKFPKQNKTFKKKANSRFLDFIRTFFKKNHNY